MVTEKDLREFTEWIYRHGGEDGHGGEDVRHEVDAFLARDTPEQKRERAAQLLREANAQEGYDVL